ncbi:MAG: hypothetical protein LQ343_001126 [Gyalolechia ehrenbergii]|nr:MAG: hypothetical protein LQ343_001126 [Gyalolechia ehrenbergii]
MAQDAQIIRATNNVSDTGDQFELAFNAPIAGKTYHVDPLTDQSTVTGIESSGTLRATNPGNVNSLPANTIAYISCDADAYPGNIDPVETFNQAIHHSPPPVSVILYSSTNRRCEIVPKNIPTPPVYTMQDHKSSEDVFTLLQSNTTMVQNTTISRGGSDDNGGGGILGKSPTTAVAMIILYSITGLITALFLIIIVVGAVRAHRHPERYGPRNIIGRPRQSRAKGIARAMLETIPIVKFGDHDNVKPRDQARDIEMVPPQTIPEASTQGQAQQEVAAPAGERRTTQEATNGVVTEQAVGQEIRHQPTNDPIANADNGLACSVCTDDFAKGQDVRVLPCNHKFHPECIDPWLLNVSGTCPLCRVDLRPTTSYEDGPPNHNGEQERPRRHSEALTSFAATPQANQSRRSSRPRPLHYLHHYLNRGLMEEATPQERLEALRNLRLVNRSDVDHVSQQDGGEASVTGDRGTRNRLSARFSRAFGGDRSRPVSWAPPRTPTPVVQESRNEDSRDEESGAGTGAGTETR